MECIQIDAAGLIKDTSHDILGWDSLKYQVIFCQICISLILRLYSARFYEYRWYDPSTCGLILRLSLVLDI
jgi:hypothetical protein